MIPEGLLHQYGASVKRLKKGQMLFFEGDDPVFHYQVKSGSIKMFNYGEEEQEVLQGIFGPGQSFGEPALLGRFPYPACAQAIENSEVYRLSHDIFEKLLAENAAISLALLKTLSNRLRFKTMLSKEIKGYHAAHRILTLIDYMKKESKTPGLYEVKITRQTIADLTGLRVETVIRTIQDLKKTGELVAKGRKIFRS